MRPDTKDNLPGVKVLACTALLAAVTALAGCGGSGQKPAVLGGSGAAAATATSSAAPGTSDSSSSAAPTTSAPSSSASPSPVGDWAAFPGFKPSPGLKVIVDPTPSTGDPTKDKIISDYAQVLKAIEVWSATGDFNTPGVPTYLSAALRGEYQAQFVQYRSAGKVPTGLDRYYDFSVPALSGNTARVIACEDGRQGFDMDAKTGKVIPGSSDGIVAIVTTVTKDSAGVWQAGFMTKEANSACKAP